MILLLGATGYVGTAFQQLFQQRGVAYRGLSRQQVDYTDRDRLIEVIKDTKPAFLINAAGYTGKPNVDACEIHKAECLQGNAVLPGIVREACEQTGLPWGHVSSGCIYTGKREDGGGFTELDAPNFSFRTDNSSFYSGCKAIGEECLEAAENAFIWRLRIPFDNRDNPRNYLTKLIQYPRLLEAENSVSQLDEFAQASFDCWQQRVPFGIYNVTNTGSVTTRQVTELIRKNLLPDKEFDFFANEAEFMQIAAKTPRSNCVLDNSKLRDAGIKISDVEDALVAALKSWQSET